MGYEFGEKKIGKLKQSNPKIEEARKEASVVPNLDLKETKLIWKSGKMDHEENETGSLVKKERIIQHKKVSWGLEE